MKTITTFLLLGFVARAQVAPGVRNPPQSNISTGVYAQTRTIANDTTTGTTVNKLAKMSSSGAIILATTDTTGSIGVVVSGAGTTSNAEIANSGIVTLAMDGAATKGNYVQISSTVAGDGHDAGASCPTTTGQVIGVLLQSIGSAGNASVLLTSGGCGASSSPSSGGLGYLLPLGGVNALSCGASLYFGAAVNAVSSSSTTDNNAWRIIVPKDGTIKAVGWHLYGPGSPSGVNSDGTIGIIVGSAGTGATTIVSGLQYPSVNGTLDGIATTSIAVTAGSRIGGKMTGSTCSSGSLGNVQAALTVYIE